MSSRTRLRLAAACLVALGGTGAGASAAHAAGPVVGPAGAAFYTVPAAPGGSVHGDLIQYRQVTVKLGLTAPKVNAWKVMYRTTNARGGAAVATGTVLVPRKAYSGKRPIVTYAVGTQGLGTQCRASDAYEQGTQYDAPGATAALSKNFTVLSTDYQGYTNGDGPPPYIAGKGEAYDVLDIVKAASQIPGATVDPSAKTAIWGYSQGGQAAAWAGQLESTYTPELNVVGVAAGGVPADLAAVAPALNGNVGAAFLGYSIIGLDKAYPGLINLAARLNDEGRKFVAQISGQCVFTSLPTFAFRRIESYETAGTPIDQLLKEPGPAQVVADNYLGKTKIQVPVYQYHALLDEIIPYKQAEALKQRYCGLGVKVQWRTIAVAEHLTGDFRGVGGAADWIADRVAGKTPPSSC